MSEVLGRVDKLSPERRALLQKFLQKQASQAHEPGAIRPREGGGPAPLSFAQERLWFVDRLEPGSATYNIPVAWRLSGALDVDALERSLGEIVRRHEALRTVFAEVDGSPVQVAAPFGGFALPVEELPGLGEADRDAAVRRRADEEAGQPFDLSAGPLFRALLLRLDAEDHALLLSMHHIASDGWSMGVLFREISALYKAYREGRESPLPELALQYADYAVWQREQLEGEVLDRQLAYWRERLSGAPELLELPTDRPRPPVRTYGGASVPVELSPELLERLQALGRSEGATLYMTVLGAFQVLLSKYSGSEDIVVGSPIAGRTRKEVEALIGSFVNPLVLRTDLSGDPGFREVLRRVRDVTLGAYEHQEVPFEKLVAELQPERSLSHSPLFQVMFALQNAVDRGAALPGLEVSGAGAELAIAKVDLYLVLSATAQGLRGGVTYSTDLFDHGTVERMLGHLERVLEQVAADADVRLSRLELLGEAERALVLEEWNRTEAESPADRCIHELFEVQAARTPDAEAVSSEGERVTYAKLNERANRLAHHLAGLGVGPETRVGICLERGPEMVVSVLAVLKAGGAYVPLDPAYPVERLAFVLADAAVPVLVTQESLRAGLPAGDGVAVVSVDGDGERIAAESAENPDRGVSPDQLAYVIHTSGSTGTPKGVMVPHRGVPNLAYAQAHRFGIDGTSRVLQFASPSFDAAVAEVFDALLAGATLVLAPREELLPGAGLLETLRRGRVTVATLPPSVLAILPPDDLPELRTVVSAGEAVDAATVERWSAGRTFVNAYGPTETTVCATSAACEADGRAPAIGRPLENVRVYVLDVVGTPAPVGVPGELYVGGVGVVRGYLGRPGLTAERFVPDPLGREPGARLYRTGDRVRWRPDGTIEFLGRKDFQVKICGFRVELGEIEARLAEHPGVREAVVVAREEGAGDRRLVAYWTGEEGVDVEALRAHLGERLPEYMVPAAYVHLDALPLTPSGKLDRRALPSPEGESFARHGHEAPVGEFEQALAEVWSALLGVERVGRNDDFFELGGHSLLALQMATHLQQVLELEVEPGTVFGFPVLKDLAEVLAAAGRAELPPIQRVDRGGRLPLSFAQQRLWFLEQMGDVGSAYHVPLRLRLRGALDRAALRRALDGLVARHEVLRTTFPEQGGEPEQRIAPETTGLHLVEQDLAGEPDELERVMAAEATAPFDLERGPLIRGRLIRMAADENVLLLSMHHIVADGWSMGVFYRELAALYEAYREGRESPLAEPGVQYADYAVWQREQLAGEVLERQLSYWRERLAGAPELLELPTDHPRPAVQSFRGAMVSLGLPLELLERLQALGRSEGTTLYMTLLGAFQVLLSKYSGSEDVVVGSPTSGRTRPEVEELIGFFVNTLVLRTDLSGDPSFREVLGRVREVTLGAYRNQEVPFEQLVAELQPERSMSHSPLFQVMFTLGNGGGGGGALAGLEVRTGGAPMEIAKFALSLTLEATPQGLRGGLNYSTDLFERGTIERMLGHLSRVLEQVAADADMRLSRLALAGPEERARVVEAWNRTERAYPRNVCVHELFEAQVRERPGAVALAWGDESLTYRELDVRANRLAHHLVGLGVGPDARVGVLLERSAELIVSILAVLKAGGCYVPLDPGYPPERLRLMMRDSSVRVLLSRGDLASLVPESELDIVDLDHVADALASESTEAPRGGAAAENLAYIVYTSGSTGKPKGVMVAHRHVVQLVVETDYARIRPGDRVAQASNAAFDALTFEMFGALLNGATLVGIDREVLLSPPAFREFLRENGITTLYQTTALLNQLSREVPDIFAPLRDVLFGGQAVDADSVRRLLKAGGPERLLHMYGPTETTAWCSWEQVEHVAEDALTVSVGGPTGNQRIYLLDSALNPVPVGVPGEAYVGGDGVVRGYLDRPGLTAERFVPDPFAAEPGARMYRTGDRLRWKADGRLEFIGRVDEQVKIRGFRIEPGEIEAVLSAHPEVREARVIVGNDASGEQRLVAYVVGAVEAEGLRDHLRESLPEYMVPAAFVVLERLPLTPAGKLDVGALPAPELGSAEDRYVAPRTPVEEVLAEIWAEVLRLERVGVSDDFFELGGHSLLAIRVVSRIRAVFSVELPLRALFEGSTLAELAKSVEDERRSGLPVLPPVVPTGRAGAPPLSFAQERLWFLDQLEPGSTTYNIPVAWRLGGALDEPALERALGEIVRRHEALRTTFTVVDGTPVQVVAPFGGFTLPVEDLSGSSDADREAAVGRRAGEEARRPFDLSAGPLFRAALLRVDEEDHVLLISMHHIVSDGWSMGVLFRELSALYAAYRDGGESPLTEPAVQYADYAVWQREQLAGEVLDRQLSYWKDQLSGAPELLELPTDRPRSPARTYQSATVPVSFSPELLERLQALGRSEGTTLFMTVLGAFQVLLSKYAGSEDVVVGSPIAGRTRREVEELIGFFVNTLVLRTDLSGDPSFRETLGRVREVTLGAYEHQEMPFERLVEELQPERSLSHSPLFQVMFTLQSAGGEGGGGGGLPGLKVGGVGAELEGAKFDLFLGLAATPRGLVGGLYYSTDLFEPGTIERMAGHLERVLEQVAADADVRLSRLDLLGEAERAVVLEEWNRTEAEYPADRCIHELIEAQAARTPGAVAVVFEEAELTYAELDEQSNRLAHHLARLGVGREARVGVCLERGLEMVVSLLAVLKAGGAYVPLDPAYPAERLAFTLADSGVVALLTQESLRSALPVPEGVTVVSVDGAAAEIARESEERIESAATPRSLAYLIYTSGSTGVPKGVAIEHESTVALLSWAAAVFTAEELSGVLAATSISFDLSVFEIFLPLSLGGRVIVVENALALPRSAAAHQVRLVNTVPSAITALLKSDGIPAGVRTVNLAGEPLRAELVDALYARGGIVRVYDLYGPSEDTTYSTWTLRQAGGPTTIGRPISNTQAYVLGAALLPLPVGVPGELYLGGRGLARGYLGRPGLTAERFVPDPFSAEAGARLYRTGDRARWRADGTLEYLGRLDAQVKVRGFRIELGEVEAALRRSPGVTDCVVVAREDAPGDRRLVAYVVGGVEADALRAYLRQSLPEYMVPFAFVPLDRLPLTPNGKVDRKALPAPEYEADADRYVAPRTPVEEVLAGIWAEVLRLERVGVEESFFELGGHSLLAMRMVSRIREVFGVELPLRALFEGPTVAELAGRVEEMRRAGLPVLPPVVPTGRAGPLPLSFAQERLWFIDRLEPGSATYNIPAAWRLGGTLDERALERALGEVVRRHEALRTTFAEADGSPVQVIAPFGGFALPMEELSGLGDADREAALRLRVEQEAARPFDLSAGPLFRPALLRLGAEDHVLLLCMHHILTDQWSMEVLRRELSTLYAAYREGGESPLPELAVQYADYAVWQREQLRGEVLDRHLAYWKERLAGAPELLELPTDRPRPAVQTYRGAHEGITLSGELLARLEALGRGEGATLYMTLLGAFQVLLSKYGGSEDVVVGSPISGRTRREVEELIGLFLNTLALRTDLSGDPGFRAVLRRVREVTLGAFEHQEIPFERLVTELQPGRSLSHSPLFQVMFVLQEAGRSAGAAASFEPRDLDAGSSGTSKFDLTLFMVRHAGGLAASLEYNTDLFDRATVRRMLGHLKRVLEEVAGDADVRLSRLALLEDAERRQVVAEWNATDAAYPRERCAHELFEARAERTPGAVAVRHAGGSLTYGELEERANRLARHLRGLGVGPDSRVGLCLERGPELMVGVLGILKAGGCYVPLDPAYPGERLAYMLEDSAARVLLTQASLAERLPAGGAAVVRLDADAEAIGREGGERLGVPVGPDNLAYVIYTSGSTGRPKGVAMPHRPLVNLLAWQEESGRAPAGAVTLQFTSISFDVSFQEIFSTWCAGGTLVLVSEETRADMPRLARLLESEGIERLFLPFIALQHLAEASVEQGIAPASLREVITAGEQLRVTEPIRRWFAGMPGCVLVNQYGPSETHVVSARVLEGEPAGWPSLPSIGAPVANTRLYVLDPQLEPAPIGVPGELLLGGDAVARGYLERPGLTAERFVPDPFGAAGGRLYRTGDRARWLPGGEVEYLGRTDEQVKVRGFRIEPGEVEAVLSDHPEVREAVVVVREDAPGDRRLVAYVVAGEPAAVTPAELRAHLKGRLPEYMVPSAVVVLESLPLTPSGKVARRALPAPDFAAAEERHVAPRTPTEEALAGIWAEVLRLKRVGVEDSFFELGGHSLRATQVVSRIRGVFGVELPLRALFEGPTVAELAIAVERLVLARVEEPDLADALELLERLSEDEVRALLGGN